MDNSGVHSSQGRRTFFGVDIYDPGSSTSGSSTAVVGSTSTTSATAATASNATTATTASTSASVEGAVDLAAEPIAGPSNVIPSAAAENKTEASISSEGNWLSYSDLMTDSYPAKSKVVYIKAFKLFEKFLKSKNQWEPNTCPSDLHVLNYFYYLRHELKWAPTTLWSTYARINAVMKQLYGVSLNSFTRVGDILKSYDSGHVVKRAGIFTPQQIEDFVSDPELSSKYWLVRKAVCLIGYYGGFRNIELKSLKFENVEMDSMGYWFQFARSKQRGRLEATSICVPRRQADWIPVVSDSSRAGLDFDPASLIDLYLAEVQSDLLCSREELQGDFFRATHGSKGQRFTKLPLGKNTIGRVGVQVARELCLARPEIYTGHCWRRSCGTSASDSGVNVTTLMAMMGWSNPKTAMVYVKKSRMTSLSLSLYLTNVQRRNCSNPFPKSPLEKRQAVVKDSKVATAVVPKKSSPVDVSTETSNSFLKAESSGDFIATQDLIRELESEEENKQSQSGDFEAEGEVGIDLFERVNPDVNNPDPSPVSSSSERVESRDVEVVVNPNSNQTAFNDPRISGILQNLQNAGNLTIHFHFDGSKN